jgi:predicted phage terminase large subunit-like protein
MTDNDDITPVYASIFQAFAQRAFYHNSAATELIWPLYLDLMTAKLLAIERGEIKRLVVCLPPRSLKSHMISVAFVAWILGRHPSHKLLCVSYAQQLSNNLAKQCRDVMEADFYKRAFPTRIASDRRQLEEYHTTAGGYRMATSVLGSGTGFGADGIIIDDPIKADDVYSDVIRSSTNRWFHNTLSSRLNDQRFGWILCVMQRLHTDDMAAQMIAAGWDVLILPAIANEDEEIPFTTALGSDVWRRREGEVLSPERQPLSVLLEERGRIPELTFSAQYQQRPFPAEGNIIKRDWISYYEPYERPDPWQMIVQSWDTAMTDGKLSDYSVCTTWGIADDRIWLIDVYRGQLDYPALRQEAIRQAFRYKPNHILVEAKVSGIGLVPDLHQAGVYAAVAVQPKDSKAVRLFKVSALFQNGIVRFPTAAPWLDALHSELLAFPSVAHDDQVDSVTQALAWFVEFGHEPGLIRYYREEVQKLQGHALGLVRLRSPTGAFTTVSLRDGRQVNTDAEGIITVNVNDKGPLLLGGWALV